jgi:hypothetical protein
MEVTMKYSQPMRRQVWLKACTAAAALGLSGIALAADPAYPAPQGATPMEAPMDQGKSAAPAAVPSTTETADTAFKKLAAGKKFVSPEDTKALPGFDKVFDAADIDHDGHLTAVEFKNAWKAYQAGDKATRG